MLAGVPSRGAITYAGHATVLIEMGEARLLTDPLLRERLLLVLRRHSGVDRDALGRVDGVLISHLHRDHLDLASLRQLGRSVPILAPPRVRRVLRQARVRERERARPGRDGEAGRGGRAGGGGAARRRAHVRARQGRGRRLRRRGAEPRLLGGRHGAVRRDAGPGRRPRCRPAADLGMGPALGPGHLDPEQAARALAMLRPRFAVPVHWGTLAPLGAKRIWPWLFERPAREFVEWARRLAPEVEVRVLEPGQSLRLRLSR